MYRVKNAALDGVYKDYHTTHLETLTQDQLLNICEKLGVPACWKGISRTIDAYRTVQSITRQFSADLYMGTMYWEARHREMAEKVDLIGLLAEMGTGRETFDIMKEYGLGISHLRPGEEAYVDWTDRFYKEVVRKTPMYRSRMLVVTRTEEPKQGPLDKLTEEDLLKMKGSEIQEIARDLDIPFVAKSRPELAKLIMKEQSKDDNLITEEQNGKEQKEVGK
jgi:hypothetical protein